MRTPGTAEDVTALLQRLDAVHMTVELLQKTKATRGGCCSKEVVWKRFGALMTFCTFGKIKTLAVDVRSDTDPQSYSVR